MISNLVAESRREGKGGTEMVDPRRKSFSRFLPRRRGKRGCGAGGRGRETSSTIDERAGDGERGKEMETRCGSRDSQLNHRHLEHLLTPTPFTDSLIFHPFELCPHKFVTTVALKGITPISLSRLHA